MSGPSKTYLSTHDYLRILKANRVLIAIVTLVCVGAAFVVSTIQMKVYTTTAALQVRDQSQDLALLGVNQAPSLPADLANAHAATVLRSDVLTAAGHALNMTPAQIKKAVTVSVAPDTNFVQVTANAGTASLAAKIANAVADQDAAITTKAKRKQLTAEVTRLQKANKVAGTRDAAAQLLAQQRLSGVLGLSSVATPVVVQAQAPIPGAPSSPKPVRDAVIAAILGLIIGMLISFARNALDRRLVAVDEIIDTLQLPMLGHVHADTLGIGRSGDGNHTEFDGLDMEAFRMLRQSVDFLAESHGGKLLITSATPSEGKSTVALGLALVYAAVGRRTLLVECDLRQPVLAARLGLRKTPGLSQYLASTAAPPDVLQVVAVSTATDSSGNDSRSLTCIVAGNSTSEPAELLGSDRFAEFMKEAAQAYDVVIMDSPPVLAVVDARELAEHCDRVVMCVRAHQTTRQEGLAGAAALLRMPARPTGLVVTGIGKGDQDYGYYSYAVRYATAAVDPTAEP
ncbi:MAG: polysaccharide biosynthesis tyrosine autokinase [Actinomycetota bacterium]|nr:polysaccharide biosynthesis tyrosine autokinase [Actinomycetota bacterium]